MTSIADRCANRAEGALALVPEDLGAGGSQKQRLGPAPPFPHGVLRAARGGPSHRAQLCTQGSSWERSEGTKGEEGGRLESNKDS